jgi:hypothetical protein
LPKNNGTITHITDINEIVEIENNNVNLLNDFIKNHIKLLKLNLKVKVQDKLNGHPKIK